MFADDVLVDFENTVIVWTLPFSNSISRRSHANGSGGVSAPICLECCTPFRIFAKCVRALILVAGCGSVKNSCTRWSLTRMARSRSKDSMVKATGFFVALTGEQCRDATGCRRYGGHSCRVAGSRFWVAQDQEVMLLQVIALGLPSHLEFHTHRWGQQSAEHSLHHRALPWDRGTGAQVEAYSCCICFPRRRRSFAS